MPHVSALTLSLLTLVDTSPGVNHIGLLDDEAILEQLPNVLTWTSQRGV